MCMLTVEESVCLAVCQLHTFAFWGVLCEPKLLHRVSLQCMLQETHTCQPVEEEEVANKYVTLSLQVYLEKGSHHVCKCWGNSPSG